MSFNFHFQGEELKNEKIVKCEPEKSLEKRQVKYAVHNDFREIIVD